MNKTYYKLSSKKIILGIYLLTFAVGTIMLYYVCFFLYQNFYKTIKQSEEIIFFKKQTANESIDMKKFQNIIEAIEEKTEPKIITDINNPFE